MHNDKKRTLGVSSVLDPGILLEGVCLAIGIASLVLAVLSLEGRWQGPGSFIVAAAIAFGFLLNAVNRRDQR